MAARFSEVTPNSGVDGDLNPSYQGIVVPLKGANRVMLEDGAELKVKANLPSMVKVKELTSHPPEDLTASQFKSLKSKTLRLFEMPFKDRYDAALSSLHITRASLSQEAGHA